MKKITVFLFACLLTISCCACSSASETGTNSLSGVEKARQDVIQKWKNESDVPGTTKFIEDTYKKYPNDPVISNIYFYSLAKEEYAYYQKSPHNQDHLDTAKEYAARIDPEYNGEFSDEMHKFVETIIPKANIDTEHSKAASQQSTYNSLTNSDKKAICHYIQSQYDYYNRLCGGDSGDKYSDIIMQDAAKKYGLSVSQIEIIWVNYYSY